MDSQPEFFKELPQSVNPKREFAEFRVGTKKIIKIPLSIWKDGRMRADCSAYGGGCPVSRVEENLQDRVVGILREHFGAIVEAVSEEFAREQASRPPIRRSRVRKKDISLDGASDLVYANPFQDNSTNFAKGPPWLLERPDRELKPIEKLIYARLLFPLPPICYQFDRELGVIIELDQDELAKSLGTSRCTINRRLVSLQFKGWIKSDGEPGAKLTVRFLWKEGMPESCKHGFTGSGSKPVATGYRTCDTGAQQPVPRVDRTCATGAQVSEGIEKRESRREERKGKGSSFYDW